MTRLHLSSAVLLALSALLPRLAQAQDSAIKPAGPAPVTSAPVISTPKKASLPKASGATPRTTLPIRPAGAAPVANQALAPAAAPSSKIPTSKGPGPVSAPAVAAPAAVPAKSQVDALRRFEERVFPRDPVRRVPPPALEGGATQHRSPRPGALHPPETLRSKHHGARLAERVGQPSWLAGAALPDLPVTWDHKLVRYLRYYRHNRRGQALMRYWLRRKGRHAKSIARALRRHGLPQALVYVAMIESSFDPTLTSRVGAAGLWQFMVHSGRAYGLRRDHWVDERRNPARSSDAAARHLKELYRRFGSWELALAAYNAGPGMVIAAMRKYNTNDYWQLCRYEAGLPWSTTLYVPKVLAVAIVSLNKERFGLADVVPDPPFEQRYELVAVRRSTTLGAIARAAGVSRSDVAALNPELRRGRTPPRAKVWLRVPRGTGKRFYAKLTGSRRKAYQTYVIRLGDSEADLAQLFGVRSSVLRRINGIRHGAELRPGLTILVPTGRRLPRAASAAASGGDLVVVALPEGSPRRVAGRQRVFYRVVIGDKLGEVARHLEVNVSDLASWNGLKVRARLVSGMVLQAFVKPGFDRARVRLLDPRAVRVMVAGSKAFLDQHEQSIGRRRLVYHAREGDTLKRLARRFGLSVGSLMRINRFSRSTQLRPGRRVVVYVEQRRAKRLAHPDRGKRGKRSASAKAAPRRARVKAAAKSRKELVAKQPSPPAGPAPTKAKAAPATRAPATRAPATRARPRPSLRRGKYRVQPGDTVSAIALRFGVATKRLMRLNRMSKATELRAGQRLKIPAGRR